MLLIASFFNPPKILGGKIMDYKIALAATQWWIDQITKRCKELYPTKVIERNSKLVIVDHSLQAEISRFRDELYKSILYSITFHTHLSLTYYYRPGGDMKKIISKANISKDYFPVSANMQIFDGSVEVSLNGNELQKLRMPAD